MNLQVLHSGEYELAEGARWLGDQVVFVDILSGRLLQLTGSHATVLAKLNVPLGAVAPAAGGGWIVAAGTGIALLDTSGTLNWLERPEPATSRMNDGACDPAGRFWAGSMAYDGTPGAGSLYRADPDGTVHRVLGGLTVVNGPAFTPDGTLMYVADTAVGLIYRCTLEDGEIAERELFAEPEIGAPDGMTVDNSGRLWVALWDGAAVRCYQPDASIWTTIDLPAPRPTSVCLAGDRLLITTARYGLGTATEASGALLALHVDASAPAAASYDRAFPVE